MLHKIIKIYCIDIYGYIKLCFFGSHGFFKYCNYCRTLNYCEECNYCNLSICKNNKKCYNCANVLTTCKVCKVINYCSVYETCNDITCIKYKQCYKCRTGLKYCCACNTLNYCNKCKKCQYPHTLSETISIKDLYNTVLLYEKVEGHKSEQLYKYLTLIHKEEYKKRLESSSDDLIGMELFMNDIENMLCCYKSINENNNKQAIFILGRIFEKNGNIEIANKYYNMLVESGDINCAIEFEKINKLGSAAAYYEKNGDKIHNDKLI